MFFPWKVLGRVLNIYGDTCTGVGCISTSLKPGGKELQPGVCWGLLVVEIQWIQWMLSNGIHSWNVIPVKAGISALCCSGWVRELVVHLSVSLQLWWCPESATICSHQCLQCSPHSCLALQPLTPVPIPVLLSRHCENTFVWHPGSRVPPQLCSSLLPGLKPQTCWSFFCLHPLVCEQEEPLVAVPVVARQLSPPACALMPPLSPTALGPKARGGWILGRKSIPCTIVPSLSVSLIKIILPPCHVLFSRPPESLTCFAPCRRGGNVNFKNLPVTQALGAVVIKQVLKKSLWVWPPESPSSEHFIGGVFTPPEVYWDKGWSLCLFYLTP